MIHVKVRVHSPKRASSVFTSHYRTKRQQVRDRLSTEFKQARTRDRFQRMGRERRKERKKVDKRVLMRDQTIACGQTTEGRVNVPIFVDTHVNK